MLWPLAVGCTPADDPPAGGGSSDSGGSEGSGTTAVDPTAVDGSTGTSGSVDETGGTLGTTAATTDGSESSTGEPVCDPSRVCTAPPPRGFSGPIARRSIAVDAVPECGSDFTALEVDQAFAGLTAPEFECGCACGVGTLACGGSARVRMSTPPPVTGQSPCSPGPIDGGPGGLVDATVASGVPETFAFGVLPYEGSDQHGITIDMVDLSVGGECTPTSTETATPAAWGERTIACGTGDITEGCEGDALCVPRPGVPYDGALCIYGEGDLECPAEYPDRTLLHQDYEDTRMCSECGCGAADATCVDPEVTVRIESESGFNTIAAFDAPNAFCELVTAFLFCGIGVPCTPQAVTEFVLEAGDLELDDPDVPCPSTGGVPMGEAVVAEPITFCCFEP
ncbi:MAG: hypothetical protein AAF721_39925 [Myxococcota bacterium]